MKAARKENLHFCPSLCFVPKVTLCDTAAITHQATANERDELNLSLAVAAASPVLHTGTTPWKSQGLSRELGHHCPSWAAAPEWLSCFPKNRNHRGNKEASRTAGRFGNLFYRECSQLRWHFGTHLQHRSRAIPSNKWLEQLSTMHAVVTEDVCFHLKRNQQASPKKKGQKQSHCLPSVWDNIRPFQLQAPWTIIISLWFKGYEGCSEWRRKGWEKSVESISSVL